MTPKQKGKLNEKRVLEAIKKAPVVKGYYVITYSGLARKLGVVPSVVRNTLKRLERKNLVEVRQSVAMFKSMLKEGVKILEKVEK